MNAHETTTKRKPFTFIPIGEFHSPLTPASGAPRQGRFAPDIKAVIEIDREYEECLEGIEDFDYIIVLFVFDRSQGWQAKVTPPGAPKSRGLFSTRSPRRPCPIGMTIVKLEKREGNRLHVSGIDAFDKTPVLDIKPYVVSIDCMPDAGRDVEHQLGIKDNTKTGGAS
ncbi:MAG: tRNA (N6-threonylcarbamoyladenosine(37)-N6)-methyltransferase TrmO [Candidatus Omnitrophota bacterium]|nr:MAG: tRNA (N6-threonylcarbamoyladenosine(37)-N6)-methyltransferase TrmO [Candidatus Omnitrophota bacterium]